MMMMMKQPILQPRWASATRREHRVTSFSLLAALLCLFAAGLAQAQVQATSATILGVITGMTVDDPTDAYSAGTITIGDQTLIVPRNLVWDVPANRLTLQQFFAQAPPACLANGESGLVATDLCVMAVAGGLTGGTGEGAIASVNANRIDGCELMIVGEGFIDKGQEQLMGTITSINHTDGYMMVNADPVDPTLPGVMVRLNDPPAKHSIQGGAGCLAGSQNCSADPRFTEDPDNYTQKFITGFPACIPSTVTGGARTGGSDASGVGDEFCPASNRTANQVVADATRFAPFKVGDSITAEGNYEMIAGQRFLSSHTTSALAGLFTQDNATQPDYVIFDEVEWDAAGFQNERSRLLMIGFTTLGSSQVDIFGIHGDTAGGTHEVILGTTVGNPNTINQGVPPNAGGIFKIRYDVDFIKGAPVTAGLSPCQNLINGGFGDVCPNGGTMDEEFALIVPNARDLVGRTRRVNPLNPGVVTLDLQGQVTQNGEYVNPVGVGHPEFVEIDLNAVSTPFIFAGETWNLDRRLGPGGCDGVCPSTPQSLDPFPFSGMDPRTQAGTPGVPAGAADELFAFFPFGATDLVAWPPLSNGCTLGGGGGGEPPPPPPPGGANPPVANADAFSTDEGTAITLAFSLLLANDIDADGDTLTLVGVDAISANGGTVTDNGDSTLTYDPPFPFVGTDSFGYTVSDGTGLTATGTVTVAVVSPVVDTLEIDRVRFTQNKAEWRIRGASSAGNVVTIYLGPSVGGPVIGTVPVDATGLWDFRQQNSLSPGGETTVSVESDAGGIVEGFPIQIK
jgi:hypothetical protein